MSSCERCWTDSMGEPTRYRELVKVRECTPEEQAGRLAKDCPQCGRRTIHQYTGICMVGDCKTEIKKS